ncbi:hypothetical protein [Sphingomonas sp. VNH70]|uniref:hypothetical protein n=1 Tax=Sphingomonas silueang TaxID=3156617 RepID=UPI0032B48548
MVDDRGFATLEDIIAILAEDTEYPLEGTLLHATLDHGLVSPSIFKDRGNHILYRDPDLDVLGDALLDFWEGQEGDPRWTDMELVIRDGRFDLRYVCADAIDLEESSIDRRTRIVRSYFGDKPIIYPPSPEDDLPTYAL